MTCSRRQRWWGRTRMKRPFIWLKRSVLRRLRAGALTARSRVRRKRPVTGCCTSMTWCRMTRWRTTATAWTSSGIRRGAIYWGDAWKGVRLWRKGQGTASTTRSDACRRSPRRWAGVCGWWRYRRSTRSRMRAILRSCSTASRRLRPSITGVSVSWCRMCSGRASFSKSRTRQRAGCSRRTN